MCRCINGFWLMRKGCGAEYISQTERFSRRSCAPMDDMYKQPMKKVGIF